MINLIKGIKDKRVIRDIEEIDIKRKFKNETNFVLHSVSRGFFIRHKGHKVEKYAYTYISIEEAKKNPIRYFIAKSKEGEIYLELQKANLEINENNKVKVDIEQYALVY